MGYALQTCSQSIYGARHAGSEGWHSQEVPMLTLSRICGSGIQSIVSGAQMIKLGEASTVVSGGMENLSQAPHILRGARDGWKLGRSPKVEDYMMTNLQDMTCGLFMAQTSDELCRRKGVTREEIDTFAALSHARTTTSIDNDVFADEIVPVTIKSRRGDTVLTHKDEDHVVRGTTQNRFLACPPPLAPNPSSPPATLLVWWMVLPPWSSSRHPKPRRTVMHRSLVSSRGASSVWSLLSWPTDRSIVSPSP